MHDQEGTPVRYSIMDPTGNITALVESPVPVSYQPSLASVIMSLHPEVEQVGFVTFSPESVGHADASLRMAGGEFCGNASMCAAALCLIRSRTGASDKISGEDFPENEVTLSLNVSGTEKPVAVSLRRTPGCGTETYTAAVRMPSASEIVHMALSHAGITGNLPLVRMEGISHIIIEENSAFFSLLNDRVLAENAVRSWCSEIAAPGLGLIFLEKKGQAYRLTPLVYIPGSNTVFWENSCASGSAAAGIYLSDRSGSRVHLAFDEPGGTLSVDSSSADGTVILIGRASLIGSHTLPADASYPFLA